MSKKLPVFTKEEMDFIDGCVGRDPNEWVAGEVANVKNATAFRNELMNKIFKYSYLTAENSIGCKK